MRHTVLIAVSLSIVAGCGAPVKSAGDVAPIFDLHGVSLQSHVNNLCSQLAKRQSAPRLDIISNSKNACGKAGNIAQDYKKMDKFYFTGLSTENFSDNNGSEILQMETRSQVWLNRSLIGLIATISDTLEEKKRKGIR